MNIAVEFLKQDSEMATSTHSPSFRLTSESLYGADTRASTEAAVISFLQAFPVSRFQSQESKPEPTTSGTCGPQQRTLFASYSLNPFCLKTCQDLFPPDTLGSSLVTWPKWGMWGNGELLAQETAMPRTSVTVSGSWPTPTTAPDAPNKNSNKTSGPKSLGEAARMGFHTWPTPRANSAMAAAITPESAWNPDRFPNLETAVGKKMWPTPTAHNAQECASPSEFGRNTPTLAAQAAGGPLTQPMILNPAWVEWLQGWPMGWTDLEPLAMGKVAQWLDAHGKCSHEART